MKSHRFLFVDHTCEQSRDTAKFRRSLFFFFSGVFSAISTIAAHLNGFLSKLYINRRSKCYLFHVIVSSVGVGLTME